MGPLLTFDSGESLSKAREQGLRACGMAVTSGRSRPLQFIATVASLPMQAEKRQSGAWYMAIPFRRSAAGVGQDGETHGEEIAGVQTSVCFGAGEPLVSWPKQTEVCPP